MMRKWLGALALVLGLSAPLSAQAHPHAWIDLKSTIVLDGQGRIAALQMYWLFDEFYSAFLTESIGDGADRDAMLRDVTQTNLQNLREYNYFTLVRSDGEPAGLADATDVDGGMDGTRYWMLFTVLLKTPLDPRAHDVTFAVFDPTYYIEILYAEDGGVPSFTGPGAVDCVGKVIDPVPSIEVIGLAASLDQTESAGDTLGEQFAQRVQVTCP